MKQVMLYISLLLLVRLYSGGVCIGEWKTEKVKYEYAGAGFISFIDKDTQHVIKLRGTFIVEEQ